MLRALRAAMPLTALLLTLACGDPSAPPKPASVVLVAGGGQSATVMTTLPEPIIVEVQDARGRAIRGVQVSWSVVTGGGEIAAVTSSTDASGRAQMQWTLGPTQGAQRLEAVVADLAPVHAQATAAAGAATSLELVSGTSQAAVAGSALSSPLVVRATDAYGNAVSGASVTFMANAGSVSPGQATTNGAGVAQATWTLGTNPGTQTATATLQGTAATVQFTAQAGAPAPVTELQNDVAVTGVGSAMGTDRMYRITVPAGATRLSVTTSGGTGDVDLYVRRDQQATQVSYDCRSTGAATSESCVIQSPQAGDWYVLLDAYTTYSGVTLRAAYVLGGSLAVNVTGLPAGGAAGIHITGPGGYTRTVNSSETIAGMSPATYTVFAPNVLHGGVVYGATPGTQQVTVTAGTQTDATVAYGETGGGINLDITGMYITQSVQRPDGSVPLIAGRDGLVRVFARANAINTETPQVRVRTYHGGTLVDTRIVNAQQASVPVVVDDAVLNASWNVLLPGSLIQPGMAMLVDVDPTNAVTEGNEGDNSWPASGTPHVMTVQTAPVLQARFVPVLQVPNSLQGDVTGANVGTYITTAQAMYPVPSIDADVRAPYSFSGVLGSNYDAEWSRLLSEIRTLRTADNSTRYYYGVIKPSYSSGGTGLGYIGLPAAIGVEWTNWRAETVAHEWGHNFGRQHVACGGPSNPDPNYPYTERPGALGQHGWDPRTNTLRNRNTHQDVMSYCQPTWVSDYTYEAVMNFRGTAGGGTAEPSLLVWGRVTPEGVVLEPAFEVTTRPSLPQKTGPNRLQLVDASGANVLDLAFDGYAIDHLPGEQHFSYAIPLRMLNGREVRELRLHARSGADVQRLSAGDTDAAVRVTRSDATSVRVRWDTSRSPALIVRDPVTGQVLSFARGGDVRVITRAEEVEVNVSNGVRSRAQRVRVDR